MKVDILAGAGGLLMLWSSVAMGLAYLKDGAWPHPLDSRVLGVLFGVALILAANLLQRRKSLKGGREEE